MQRMTWLAVFGMVSWGLVGCGGEDDEGFAYQGDESHFMVAGDLDGESIDFTMESAAAADTEQLHCIREYFDPLDGEPVYVETKISAWTTIDGVTRRAEIEIKDHDMSATAIGGDVTIVPRSDDEALASDETVVEWEWHVACDESEAGCDGGELNLFEEAAQDGTFTLKLFSGTPVDGVLPSGEGSVGGVVDAKWSPTEHVQVSFSAPCTETSVEVEE